MTDWRHDVEMVIGAIEMTFRSHTSTVDVLGPWSLVTSKMFWEGFAPGALQSNDRPEIRTVFFTEADWRRVETQVSQSGAAAQIMVTGDGHLDAAVAQVMRFLSLDIDARQWPQVGERDPVIADAQARLPGLRPCGFHSPYEAAAWAVLSGRIRIVQAARLRQDIIERHGDHGAFPAPSVLRDLDLDLPGRKTEYLHSVAEAALEGRLDAEALRSADSDDALATIQEVKGLGPFGAELVLIRGANAADVLPHNEHRLAAEIVELCGAGRDLDDLSDVWKPFRSWAAVHLRALREQRTHEISGSRGTREPRAL
ncbi:DNA-3-methyladenine glycosylase [Homoserinimonas sp. OAct 916]|uniref:DNA-3-methyladenine glycosylase family protein n=1 Tax=Homoserinimonas sp. OAct 916 TaxID=2211450 RepID=UPI0018E55542|nr:DNA-3-methyladenine glycosylase 2 family protein [Homoserinimonas sp. OAct 916]